MFGLRTFLMLLLLLVAMETLGQLQGTSGGPRPPNFSDFFSSVNLLELEDDIVLTDKLLERLDVLQTIGDTIESASDMKEHAMLMQNVFESAHYIEASNMEITRKANVSPSIFSINTIAARRDALKKFLLKHPFKFIGLIFSDLDEQKSGSPEFDKQIATDLTTYLGLKLMFKFILKIFGVNSEIGKFIVSVSDSMRTIDDVAEPNHALPAPFDWMELEDPSSSLVTTKENEFGVVSEVEARVTKGIISLMAAVSEKGPIPTHKEKLVIVLQDMKDITTVVKSFLWSLKHEIFPAELNYLNNLPREIISSYGDRLKSAPREIISSYGDRLKSAKIKAPSPKQDKTLQYPEFYEQLLLGRAPAVASKTSVSSGNDEKFLPAPPVYKSLPKRDVSVNQSTVINTQKSGHKSFNLVMLQQLLEFQIDDPRLNKPYEKWNILRSLFYKVNLTTFKIHYYNYFVDESSVTGRIKHLRTLLERIGQTSPSVDQEALVTTKRVINNLEKLLADVHGVRKAAIVHDPAGVEDFGEVYYNAETFLNEIIEISRATNSSLNFQLLDSSSKEMLQNAFASTVY